MEKINTADAFVCDVTTVTGTSSIPQSNSNVVFELGYAVSRLGWGRVVLLFNTAFGSFPQDLPFDFDRHRASPFDFSAPQPGTTKKELRARRTPLTNLLLEALQAILERNPEKPSGRTEMTEEQKKKEKDIANLRWLMSGVHLPSLSTHIDEMPYKIYDRAFFFYENFSGVVDNPLFHLYDNEANGLVREIKDVWERSLSYGHQYNSPPGRDVSLFHMPMDLFTSEEQEKDWKTLKRVRRMLFKTLGTLLGHIRKHYLDVDLEQLSEQAWEDYVEFKRQMAAKFETKVADKPKDRDYSKNGNSSDEEESK